MARLKKAKLNKHYTAPDGTKIYYSYQPSKNGNKPCLVFLHGWVMNYTCFEDYRQHYQSEGYPTLTLDLRGHGKSAAKKASFELAIEDLRGIFAKEKIKTPILVGFSMGGMIALKYAIMHPKELKSIVLINSNFKHPGRTVRFQNPRLITYFFKNIAKTVFSKKNKKYFKDAMIKILSDDHLIMRAIDEINLFRTKHFSAIKKNSIKDYRTFKRMSDVEIFYEGLIRTDFSVAQEYFLEKVRFDEKEGMAKINMPCLIISSRYDAFCHEKVADEMHAAIRNSKLVILTKSDHLTILQEPGAIKRALSIFLKENLPKK
jgi:pimeloyl-ACP methyl ester carboxylesterase